MKRLFVPVFLLVSMLLFGACSADEMGSLSSLSKPYAGVYACKALTFGGDDVLGKFERLDLELKYGGECVLTYRTAEGQEGEFAGEYRVDESAGELVFSKQLPLRTVERRFPYEKGAILIDLNVRGRLLHAEFRMP